MPNSFITRFSKASNFWAPTLLMLGCIVLLLGLSGCGFQPRGQYEFAFNRIALKGLNQTEMQRNMRLQLQMLGIQVYTPAHATASSAAKAEAAPQLTLTLLAEQRDRSIVTFNASGRAREVRLTQTVTFEVIDAQGQYLIAPSNITQRRELTYTDDQILGKEAEENQLITDMQKDTARQIAARLSALNRTAVESKTPATP